MFPSVVVATPMPSPPEMYVSPPMFNLARSPKVEVPIPTDPDPRGVWDIVLNESNANVPVAVVEVAKVKEVEALFNIVEVAALWYEMVRFAAVEEEYVIKLESR